MNTSARVRQLTGRESCLGRGMRGAAADGRVVNRSIKSMPGDNEEERYVAMETRSLATEPNLPARVKQL